MDGTTKSGMARRSALLAPLGLAGCGIWDDWFGSKKAPLPGKREPVASGQAAVQAAANAPRVSLPRAVANAGWPQTGGNPAHAMGHLAAGESLSSAWSADLGTAGGYRRKVLAQPVADSGAVFAMDADANVSCFDLRGGGRRWRTDTKPDDQDSTNIGGGVAVDQGVVYATNGLGQAVAMDAATGAVKWRVDIGAPARSSPTVAEGRLFVVTVEDRLAALSAADGHTIWSYRAPESRTSLLGRPAPAFSRGLVVAGFGGGEVAALRADSGRVAWTEGLGASRGRSSLADLATVRGAPAIADGRVFAMGMGGLSAAIDLPSGRRLWELPAGGQESPAIAGEWAFLLTADQELIAARTEDGQVAWVSPLPRWEDQEARKNALTWYGPLLAGDRLIVVGTSEEALAVSPYSGQILGRQRLPGVAAPVGPSLADGTLLIATDDGRLTALR